MLLIISLSKKKKKAKHDPSSCPKHIDASFHSVLFLTTPRRTMNGKDGKGKIYLWKRT